MTGRSRTGAAGALLLLVLLGLGDTGCRDAADERAAFPPLEAEPREAVAQEFRAICDSLPDSDGEYYGKAQLTELRGYLDRAPDEPLPRAVLRARLAVEQLRWGESRRATELLAEALEIAVESRLDPELRADIRRRLGLAWLRVAEQVNCIGHHDPESCIVPIRRGGVHPEPEAARRAIRQYTDYLAERPRSPTVIWLLTIAAMAIGEYPDAVPEPFRLFDLEAAAAPSFPRWPERAAAVGLDVAKSSGGGLMDDFDGDDLLDIVTSTIDPCLSPNFFHNDGAGRFEDRTEAAGLEGQLGGLNMIHADYDNDGDLDILILRGGWMGSFGRMRNSLLRNEGDGTFSDVTRAAGLAEPAYPTQTGGFADFDGDGWLDLYVGNEADDDGNAFPSQLFRALGDGTFADVAREAGVTNDRFAKSVAWGDYDNDGDEDLYVSNLGPNRLYRNEGNGRFTDVAEELGVVEPAGRSFPAWFFDVENDGDLDLFVADYGAELDLVAGHLLGLATEGGHPLLYRNDGRGGFEEVSEPFGLGAPSLPMGSNYGDLDNDGFLDLYLGTGTPDYESIAPNLMYRNEAGRGFRDVSYGGGFAHLQKGHGVAFGDLDGDGDQDLFEQMGGAYPGDAFPSALYLNPGNDNAWITLQLIGVESNRSAIGARVTVWVDEEGEERRIEVRAGSGGSFGGSSLAQEIGLGRAQRIHRIVVRWPGSGNVQEIVAPPMRAVLIVREGTDGYERRDPVRIDFGS